MTYIDHCAGPVGDVQSTDVIHSWRDFTYRRLAWLYGEQRAYQIYSGRDPETQADIAAWNALGGRHAA